MPFASHHPDSALLLGRDLLSLADVVRVARENTSVQPLPATPPDDNSPYAQRLRRVARSAAWVRRAMDEIEAADAEGRPPLVIYGVNTGFGDNAGRAIFRHRAEADRLSRNLLLSHAVATGPHLPPDAVRAAMLIRANTLAQGYSGVRREVINTLIAMLNRGVLPVVPALGSLGASGDLAPLAHLALVLSAPLPDEQPHPGANGQVYYQGELMDGAAAMNAANIPRIRLGAKEGVALINGTAVGAAVGALAWHDAARALQTSALALALSMEALRGYRDAYLPHLHAVRGHAGQAEMAAFVYALLEGSTLVRGDAHFDLPAEQGPPQDPYSLRVAPVVLGAALDALRYVAGVLTREINAVTDNPLIFLAEEGPLHLPRQVKAVSGGNFHGAPLGYALDFLKLVIADVANVAERRTFLLLDGRLNRGLPPFLITDSAGEEGLNNGLMIVQYTAAAAVAENKILAHPASVDSIPTSANREDHVSLSATAARTAAQVVANVQTVVAAELLCAYQALELRLQQEPKAQLGRGTAALLEALRAVEIAHGHPLRPLTHDVALKPYLDRMIALVRDGALLDALPVSPPPVE